MATTKFLQVKVTCINYNKKEEENMLNVLRSVSINSEVKDLQTGDRITIVNPGTNQKGVTATVVKVRENHVILFADQSVTERCVSRGNVEKFEDSDLYNWLNVDFFNTLRPELLPYVESVRVPYIKELFNWDELDNWDKENIDFTNDSHMMKWTGITRKERLIVPFKDWWSYWCMNKIKDRSATSFPAVRSDGFASFGDASYTYGVRPVLVLVKEPKKKEFNCELVNANQNIVFGDLSTAITFRDALISHLQKYGKISVMEMNDIIKSTTNFLDSNYGWVDPSSFGIQENEGESGKEYRITLGDPVRIN